MGTVGLCADCAPVLVTQQPARMAAAAAAGAGACSSSTVNLCTHTHISGSGQRGKTVRGRRLCRQVGKDCPPAFFASNTTAATQPRHEASVLCQWLFC